MARIAIKGKLAWRKLEGCETLTEARKALNKLRVQVDEGKEKGPRAAVKFKDYAEHYLRMVSNTKASATISKEKVHITFLNKHLGNRQLGKITKEDWISLRAERLKSASNRTSNIDRIQLNNIFNLAVEEGVLVENPIKNVRALKVHHKEAPFIEKETLERIINATHLMRDGGEKIRDYLLLLMYTGAREQEALQMKWQDVDLENQQITLRGTKAGGDQVIPISDQLVEHLKCMWERKEPNHQYLFPNRGYDGKPMKGLRESFRRARKLAGLTADDIQGFHGFRHHFISVLVMGGYDVRTIAQLVGQRTNGAVIMKYYAHLRPGHLKEAAKCIKI